MCRRPPSSSSQAPSVKLGLTRQQESPLRDGLHLGSGGQRVEPRTQGRGATLHCGEGHQELLEEAEVLDTGRGDAARLEGGGQRSDSY